MKTAFKIFLAVIGLLLIAAGLMCIASPVGAVSTAATIIGLVLLVTGIVTAIFYFVFGGFLLFAFPVLLNAIADILFGALFLQHPDGTSRVLTVLYGLLLILGGLTLVLIGFLARRFVENKGVFAGVLIAGAAFVVLGIVALSSDVAGAFLIAVPVGLALLAMGAGYLALDVHLIKAQKAGAQPKYFKDVDE